MYKFNKYSKVLAFSLIALFAYFSIENSDKVNAILLLLQKSKSSRGLGIFVLINLGKWFLLAFGIIGLIFWFLKMFVKKDEKYLSGF